MRKPKVRADVKVISVTLTQLYVSSLLFILQSKWFHLFGKGCRMEALLLPPMSMQQLNRPVHLLFPNPAADPTYNTEHIISQFCAWFSLSVFVICLKSLNQGWALFFWNMYIHLTSKTEVQNSVGTSKHWPVIMHLQFPLLQKSKRRKQTANSIYLHSNMTLALLHIIFSLTNQKKPIRATKYKDKPSCFILPWDWCPPESSWLSYDLEFFCGWLFWAFKSRFQSMLC